MSITSPDVTQFEAALISFIDRMKKCDTILSIVKKCLCIPIVT